MLTTLRLIDLIYLDCVVEKKEISVDQIQNITDLDIATIHNITKKLSKKKYIYRKKKGKEIKIYPSFDPYVNIGLLKVIKMIKELKLIKGET